MSHRLNALLLTTALSVPLAAPAFAQSLDTACTDLDLLVTQGLPENMRSDEDNLREVVAAKDAELCVARLTELRETMESDTATATTEATAVVAETATTTLTLQDEVTVQGKVYLDQNPPRVAVTGGDTEVSVEPGQSNVTVAQQAADIVIRQAPAEITVDMPTPTITITQAAPEIIITMPDPSVNVANARPTVEVRQADPQIQVTQSPPSVELELQRAAEGSEPAGFQVNDRRTGTAYAVGEGVDPIQMEDAEVQFSKVEPRVLLVEPTEETANVTIERAEPRVSFEQAEPTITFAQQGEPKIEYQVAGEPLITFRQDGEGDDTMTAGVAAEADTETDLAADAEALDAEAESEMAEVEAEVEREMAEVEAEAETEMAEVETEVETEMAEADAAMETRAPLVERDGYTNVANTEIEYDKLEGIDVYGVNDEEVGEIGDLVLSADGKIDGVVIEVGGFLGLGEKEVALPFDRFTFLRGDGNDLRVYIDSTEEELEGMDTYTR